MQKVYFFGGNWDEFAFYLTKIYQNSFRILGAILDKTSEQHQHKMIKYSTIFNAN